LKLKKKKSLKKSNKTDNNQSIYSKCIRLNLTEAVWLIN